jgi:rSAM/selenodomain-associated transferase 1
VRKIIIIAKAPVPGRVKTRLCPPCSPAEAAGIAEAALCDTLASTARVPHARTVLVLDGPAGPWVPRGIRVLPQRGLGLDERLAAAFADAGGPALLIGMDTPQVTPAVLTDAFARLEKSGTDAVLGFADDGGWWIAGLRRPNPRVFLGVPMSTPFTGTAQLARMTEIGLRVAILNELRDVDTFSDAVVVAGIAPRTRFAQAVTAISSRALAAGRERL